MQPLQWSSGVNRAAASDWPAPRAGQPSPKGRTPSSQARSTVARLCRDWSRGATS